MTTDARRYAVYARQSVTRDEGDSLSIEMQVRACQEFVARQGGTVARVFEDPDQRGWKVHRPAFDQMVQFLADGGADCVLVFKLSRFTRNLMHQETILTEIANAGGELLSVTEPYLNASPMVRQILGAVNEQAKRDQSDFLTAAFAGRARRGLHHGYAPIGYQIADGRLVVDDAAAETIRQMFGWALEGHGAPEIAHRLNTAGQPTRTGKAWSPVSALRTLRRQVYVGAVVHRGDVVAHDAHPAIIDQVTFDRVQSTLDRRRRIRRKDAPSWTDGFVYHACGSRMYCAAWATTGDGTRWRYRCGNAVASKRHDASRCTISRASAFADTVETWFRDALVTTLPELADPDRVIARMEAAHDQSAAQRQRQRQARQRRLDTLAGQRDRLLDMALNGRVDDDVYATRDGALKAEIERITSELAAIAPPVDPQAVRARHATLSTLLDDVETILRHAPGDLPALLHQLDVRLVIGPDGHRLAFGADTAPFFGSI